MKKMFSIFGCLMLSGTSLIAQTQKPSYPVPEFSKEVYWLKKDSVYTVMRLEKGSSKMETKSKMGGMGGFESSYVLEGEKSTARVTNYKNLSFVYSNGADISKSSSAETDSMMKANGIDASIMQGGMGGMDDPSSNITLYKVETGKGKRKILMQKGPGAMPFGSKKMQSAEKYTFGVKKIREGYWELVIDKTLPRGEYAFTMMAMGMGNMDGSVTIFSFGIE